MKKSERITALEEANATLVAANIGLAKENADLKRILDQFISVLVDEWADGRPVQGQSLGDRVRSEFAERWGWLLDLTRVGA
jgi:hypothetical protein